MLRYVALLALVWTGVSIWVGQDARTNSSRGGTLWGLITFFGGIAGFLLYFALGRDRVGTGSAAVEPVPSAENVRCPGCRALEHPDRDTCRFCGERLPPEIAGEEGAGGRPDVRTSG